MTSISTRENIGITGSKESSSSLVKETGDANPSSVVFLHIGSPDFSNTSYRSIEPMPTLVRRFAIPLDVFLQCAVIELAGNPNAKTLLVVPGDWATDLPETLNLTETFDEVTSLMATVGKDKSMVLKPITPPSPTDRYGSTMLIDNDTNVAFVVDVNRGYASAGCGSAQVWDQDGHEHWVKYGRAWDVNNPYPLDKLISSGQIDKATGNY